LEIWHTKKEKKQRILYKICGILIVIIENQCCHYPRILNKVYKLFSDLKIRGIEMGLFGKKKKEEEMEVPPPPPPEEGEEEAPPEAEKKEELPELPSVEAETHLPSELPEIKPEKEEKPSMPEFPSVAEKEEAEAPEEKPVEIAVAKPEEGPKFMPVTEFQTVLTEAEEIKNSIKETEEVISRVKKLRDEEEGEFEKWRKQLEGVEKKLNYVDSMIFKGE
jgi:hypothetical protein